MEIELRRQLGDDKDAALQNLRNNLEMVCMFN